MYLQLAEGENNGNYAALAESPTDLYVFIPAGVLPEFTNDTYVRADYFSKYDLQTANNLLNMLAPYQPTSMNEGLVSSAVSFVPGGAVASKGIEIAKKLMANRAMKVAAGEKKPIFKAGGKLDQLKNKLLAVKTAAPKEDTKSVNLPTEEFGGSVQLPGGSFNVGYVPTPPTTENTNFFTKYKTPLLIGGGVLAVGGLILALRKKKK
jgi:hypothetical protein